MPTPKAVVHFPLLGWVTLTGILILVVSTALLEAGIKVSTVSISVILNLLFFVLALFVIAWIGYLVFGTHGIGHYQLRVWHTFDILLGEFIAQTGLSMVLWMTAALRGNFSMYSHTGDVDPFYAVYDLFLYTVDMLNGGGIVDSQPVGEVARLFLSLQLIIHSFTILVVLSALVATLTVHSDERAKTQSTSTSQSLFEISGIPHLQRQMHSRK
jgi:hypothetical protein